MRAATIEAKLAELRADRDSISWRNRISLVNGLLGDASRVRTLSPAASELLRLLAADSKWEVRKEIADHLPKLGDSDFATFAAILTDDDNAYVRAAAERALAGRRKGHLGSIKRAKGLDRMEDELQKVQVSHGTKVSSLVRDMAQRLYEGLVGSSVHEMRSVVTAMKLDIEQLARTANADESAAGRITPRLAKSVEFLEQLLDDMRDYTRAPSRERATERVDDLFRHAMEMVRAEFSSKGRDASPVTVVSEIPAELTASVSRVQIVLALRNLLKNAHESFMLDEVSFEEGEVRFSAEGDGEAVFITITDNGMGLAPDELEALRQFIPGKSSKGNLGTGFGLPIARRNIRAHGGDLFIESEVDVGTCVKVWLPINGKAVS
jgi:signal transduction histidine kinase